MTKIAEKFDRAEQGGGKMYSRFFKEKITKKITLSLYESVKSYNFS